MTTMTFAVGHRTTHGFPLIIALAVAAMLGFIAEISRPVNVATSPEPEPQPAPVSEPLAAGHTS